MLRRGALGRCPQCGQGALFRGLLDVTDRCGHCGLEFHGHDAGDGPAVALWSLEPEEPQLIATIGAHQRPVESVAFSADGRWVLSVGEAGVVLAWPATAAQRRELACEVVRHSPGAYAEAVDVCR